MASIPKQFKFFFFKVRTRIAKNTDLEVIEKRKTRNPRAYDIACQTDPHVDFQPIAEYLEQVSQSKTINLQFTHLRYGPDSRRARGYCQAQTTHKSQL